MNEQELRIGNWVFLKSQKEKPYQIHSGQEITTGCDSDDFEPIPLSHPILAKHYTGYFFDFNINKVTGINYEVSESVRLRLIEGSTNTAYWQPILMDYGDNEIKLPPIQYLHQLQNLVFALSGKELEINLSL